MLARERRSLMRRFLSLIVVALLVVVMPTAAMAAVEKSVNEFDDTFEDPFAAELCGVDQVFVHIFGTEKVTEFLNTDSELVKIHVQVTGRTEVTDGDGNLLAWENFAEMIIIDFERGTVTENGNVFNVHVQGKGVVVNDSGKIVFSLEDGSLLDVKGPHEAFFTPPPVLICEALTS
jgi:putative cell wall-binding protein